ncbi:aldehyde dehydrogenase family protein [Rhodanobacter lindaniclasticus]
MAPVFRFTDEDAVVAAANGTPYGRAAYFYTRDVRRIAQLAAALEAGLVGINKGAVSSEAAPFGGIKASGYGREGSRHGLDEYMQLKYLCRGGLDG